MTHFCGEACTSTSDCPVWRELRLAATAEGRAQLKREYDAALTQRRTELDARPTAADVVPRLQRVGVPGQALGDLLGMRDTPAVEGAKKWLKADKGLLPGLVLCGPTGLGKTVAAAFCAQEFARDFPWNTRATGTSDAPLVWLEAAKLTRVSQFGVESEQVVREATEAQLLVVDDAGHEASGLGLDTLVGLLMGRLDRCRRTVLTSNLRGEKFTSRYSAALANRLREKALVPKLEGESLRQRRAA